MTYTGKLPGQIITSTSDSPLRVWTGTATASSGIWTCDISDAGFTEIIFVAANARPRTNSNINSNDACYVSVSRQESTTSLIKGYAKESVTAGLLAVTVTVDASTVIDVMVMGI